VGNKRASEYRVSSSMGSPTIQTLSANSSVTNWNYTVKADATTAQLTATLPTSIGNDGKQIEIIKTDNSNNSVIIAPFGTETINGSTNSNPIYLFNQNDSVVIRSDGANSYIVADNRNSTGSSNSFLRAVALTPITTVSANSLISMNNNVVSIGNKIINNLDGTFTLLSGSVYKVNANLSTAVGNDSSMSYCVEYYDIDSTWKQLESSAALIAPTAGNEWGRSNTASCTVKSSTTDTKIRVKILGNSGVTSVGAGSDLPYIEIEEVSRQATVLQTVDYIFARVSANVTTANTTIPVSPVVGNIGVTNNMFSLKVGSTYELEAFIEFNGNTGNVWAEYVWTDSAGTYLPTSTTGLSVPVQSASADSSLPTKAIITPTQNMSVKVMTTGTVAGITGIALTRSYFKITQIGSTAVSKLPTSLIDTTGEISSNFALNSTLYGFVCPRMSQAQRLAIVSPPEGLEVYQTDVGNSGKYVYNGTKWDKISNLAYLKASNLVAVNPAVNILLNFSGGVISNCIKTNHGNGQYTLYAGVYELMGVQLLNQNDMGISYQFYNYTTASYMGEQGNAADVSGSAGTGSPAFAILECTVDTQIGLRCSNDSATVTATEGNWLKIKQIS